MNFMTYRTTYDFQKTVLGDQFADTEEFAISSRRMYMQGKISPEMDTQVSAECKWIKAHRPYYSVWPKVANSFVRTSLDCPGSAIQLPISPLLIRFSEQPPFVVQGQQCHSVLCSHLQVREPDGSTSDGLVLWCDFGEMNQGAPVHMYRAFSLDERPITEALDEARSIHNGLNEEEENASLDILRVVLATCMVGEGDMLEADVLAKDRAAYARTEDPKYIDKAHRRKKIGWHVGAKIESSPHIRVPHFGIRWMGKGRKIPRLRPIKGSVVNRKAVTQVPTGFMEE